MLRVDGARRMQWMVSDMASLHPLATEATRVKPPFVYSAVVGNTQRGVSKRVASET